MNPLKKFFVFALLLTPSLLFAQLQVSTHSGTGAFPSNWNADSLVRNVLLGEGVEVSNVMFNGSTGPISCNAIGKFTTGVTATNLGILSGLIISTGSAADAAGAASGFAGGSGTGCSNYPNAQMTAYDVGNNGVNDCRVLEFDFVPRSDSIKFRYVFGSEEYPEYVCNGFNDIFGFFLSGPSPFGGMYTNKNIALIPNSNPEQIISINSVNGGTAAGNDTPCDLTNSQYYVNNENGSSIQYDGFTVVLTAEAKVIPCQTYHLVMAIADLGDGNYDSGVFLEANSLTSNAITFNFDNSANPTAPSDVYEGCNVYINMHRPTASSVAIPIAVSVEGTAINGQDFASINPYISFPIGQTDMQLAINPYMDGFSEGNGTGIEDVKFVFSPENGCPRSDSVEFNIIDTEPIHINVTHDSLSSFSTTCTLTATVDGGMPEQEVTWTKLRTGQTWTGTSITINVYPSDSSLYMAHVEDNCLNMDDTTFFIGIIRNFAFESNDTTICEGQSLDLAVRGADSCVWYVVGETTPFNNHDTVVHVTPAAMTQYVVHSFRWWKSQYWEDIDSVLVMVVPAPDFSVTASRERICEGESVTITAHGVPNISWDNGTTYGTSLSNSFNPDTTTVFYVYGMTGAASCTVFDSIVIQVDTMPVITLSGDLGVCDGEPAELQAVVGAESIAWSASPADPSLGGQENLKMITVNPTQTTVYTLDATTGVCHTSKSISVAVEKSPVAIGTVTPRTVSLGEMEAVFTDESQYSTTRRWELPDGSTRETESFSFVVPDDIDSMTVRLWAFNPYLCFDTTTVTVYVDHTTLWVPNAFTPEESTNNTFDVKMNDVQRYHIFIYNRGGDLVFESKDPEEKWTGLNQNGEKCPQGAYVYLISCHKITYPYEQIVRKGTVMVIR